MDEANVNRAILKAVLEKAQDDLIDELCGRKYARSEGKKFTRAGTAERTLVTRHGTIKFRLVKVKSLENEPILRPFLLYIGLEPRRRVIEDFVFECAEVVTYLTYRDSKTVIENLTKAKVSRHRIHSNVQKVGRYVEKERTKNIKEKVNLMYGDGTKAHGLNGKRRRCRHHIFL